MSPLPRRFDDLRRNFPSVFRAGGVVFVGDVASKFLTFLITLFLLRVVSPSEYMLYGVFITVLAACNQLTDLGLHQSFVKFYAFYAGNDERRARAHLQLAFRLKGGLILVVGTAMFFGASSLADHVFLDSRLAFPLRVVSFAVASNGLHEFFQAVFQGRSRFTVLTAIRLIEAAGKLAAITALMSFIHAGIDVVYIVYAASAVVTSVIGFVALRGEFRGRTGIASREVFTELFSFGKWMIVATFATMLLMRIDVFMITPMLSSSPDEIGWYAAAVRLCTPLMVLTGSVSTVFYPKAMALRSYAEMKRYVANTLRVTLPLAGLSVLYLVLVVLAVPHAFPKYVPAVPVFAVLWIGYAWTIIGNPLTMLVMTINRARTVALINGAQLLLTAISHYVFISLFRGLGAAVSTVIMWFLAGTASLVYLWMHRRSIDHA